jgi:hypothetical protein
MADDFILETHGLTKEFAGFFRRSRCRSSGPPWQHSRLDRSKRGRQNHVFQSPDQVPEAFSASQILYKFVFLDIAPVNVAVHSSNLQPRGGRDVEYAKWQYPVRFAILSLIQRALLPRLMVLAPESLAVTLTGSKVLGHLVSSL